MSAQEPVRLHVEALQGRPGDPRPAITLVHGFTQNSRCWSPFDGLLGAWGPVAAVDLPGHGRSGPAPADLWAAGRALAATGPTSVHLGYSLGGRVLLHTALSAPGAVSRLVLIGAHPGIEDPEERRLRRTQDVVRAERLARIGTASFLDEWLALPLFDGLDPARGHREERLANDAGALAGALRTLGTGTQDPLWNRLGELSVPALVLAGERDERFVDIGRRTARTIGTNATFASVPAVGHAAQLEDPAATAAIVTDWMRATG